MNKVFLIGNLTRDPEAATTQSGINYCRFTIGVTRRMSRDKDTDFINIIVWRGLADNCVKYLNKGSKVAVCGSIQTGSYEKDGQKRYTTDIVADEVQFLSTRNYNDSGFSQVEPPSRTAYISEMKAVDEDLPF
ncbi:MAG: single-stranded DNA-binding protein [Christensenellales bacterium]|jgi:single-strand DNA-binding protein